MDWGTAAEIFGIFSGIVAGGWILALVLGKAMKEKWTTDGEHNQIHEDIAGDIHAAHSSIRNHEKRISSLESVTSEISGKLDQSLENQKLILSHLIGGGK